MSPANDPTVLPIVMEITQADRAYAQKSLDYMREKGVFAHSLEIPAAAIAKTIELMVKADLLDPAAKEKAATVLDDSLVTLAREASRGRE